MKDFGAVCDGTTYDTAAIDAAINSGHKGIEFPAGVCLYVNPTTGTPYPTLASTQIYSASRTTISFTNNGSADNNGSGWTFSGATNLTLQGLTFQYQTPPTRRTNCGVPLTVTGSTNVFLSDIAILNSPCAGLALYQNTGLQANHIRVQKTWADGIQNQDNIGMVETNLYISDTGDDGLAMHCTQTSTPCASSTAFPNYGMAANIVEDHIGTFGAAGGGKAISIDGGKGITVNGVRATNVASDCVQVYSDGTANGNVPDAITLNDIGCSNVGTVAGSGGATGIEVNHAKNVYINNPNVNQTLSTAGAVASGIRVDDETSTVTPSVWVNGGVLQNLTNEGVRVDHAKLFHMVGTEIRNTQTKGVTVSSTGDVRLSDILVYDSVIANGSGDSNRAVDIEGITALVDVHNITIQDDQSSATGFVFFTAGNTAKGTIDSVTGYVASRNLEFDTSGTADSIVRRNFSARNANKPDCSGSSSFNEGLTWYTYGSGGKTGALQVCKNALGTYAWATP